jgi:Protein of unknown function (DUF3054)
VAILCNIARIMRDPEMVCKVCDFGSWDGILHPMNTPIEPELVPEAPPRAPDKLPIWELIALFFGDFITLIVFGILGQARHELLLTSSQGPVAAVVNTASPFMLSWLLIAIFAGTYRGSALYPFRRVVVTTLVAGIFAGPLGVVFWAIARRHWPVAIFYVVTTGISTIMLLVWRVLWSRVRRAWWPELP